MSEHETELRMRIIGMLLSSQAVANANYLIAIATDIHKFVTGHDSAAIAAEAKAAIDKLVR